CGESRRGAGWGFWQKALEVLERPVGGVYVGIVRDVVAVVLQRRRVERQQPDGRDAQILQVIEPFSQSREIPPAAAAAIATGADRHLVNDGIPVPLRVGVEPEALLTGGAGGGASLP